MKHLDTMQEGGYPFDDVSIAYLQEMFNNRDGFVFSVFGDKKIVSGCILDTQTNLISDGLITYNGKLYHFVGGAAQAQVSLQKVETSRNYEDGNDKKAFINEFFEFGTNGTDVMDFTDLKRWYQYQPIYKELKEVAGNVTNATLPAGWFIADGDNGTDDLRSLFTVSKDTRDVDYNTVGKSGGEKKHQLTISEMPQHRFGFNDDQAGGDTGDGYIVAGDANRNQSLSGAFTEYLGNDTPHENRPPYYVVVKIQFIGI